MSNLGKSYSVVISIITYFYFNGGVAPEMGALTPPSSASQQYLPTVPEAWGLVCPRLLAAEKLYWSQADKAAAPIPTTPVHTIDLF